MQRRETADDRNEQSTATSSTETDRAGAYEPPKLIRLGTLKSLLGKTGTIPDKQPPFELRE